MRNNVGQKKSAPDNAAAPGRRRTGGVLLVGHGTRDPIGRRQFLALAGLVAERLDPLPVEPCFLELTAPSIQQGAQRLVEQGARAMIVAPTLLFAAGHANQDIPAAVSNACRACGERVGIEMAWEQAAHLGCHDAIVELSRRRECEALAAAAGWLRPAPRARRSAGKGAGSGGPLARLLVGRGSRDVRATQEMSEFVARRDEVAAWRNTLEAERRELDAGLERRDERSPAEACFLAMAEPLLPAALRQIAVLGYRRVLVQPHLLFAGELTAEIGRLAAEMAERHPDIAWMVAEPLGPDRLVAEALCDRVAATRMARAWGLPPLRITGEPLRVTADPPAQQPAAGR